MQKFAHQYKMRLARLDGQLRIDCWCLASSDQLVLAFQSDLDEFLENLVDWTLHEWPRQGKNTFGMEDTTDDQIR